MTSGKHPGAEKYIERAVALTTKRIQVTDLPPDLQKPILKL